MEPSDARQLPLRRQFMGSLDWPLSREEKKGCALALYEQDLHAANHLLRTKDRAIGELRSEVSELRRLSLCSTADGCRLGRASTEGFPPHRGCNLSPSPCRSPGSCDDDDEDSLGDCGDSDVDVSPSSGATAAARGSPASSPAGVGTSNGITASGAETPRTVDAVAGRDLRNEVSEARLRTVLSRFYERHRERGQDSGVEPGSALDIADLARRFSGERSPALWARIARKYNFSPAMALHWLGRTLESTAPVQFPRGNVPEAARFALDVLAARICGDDGVQEPLNDRDFAGSRAALLRSALGGADVGPPPVDFVRALVFRGCPDDALRPPVWMTLLGIDLARLPEQRAVYRRFKTSATSFSEGVSVDLRRDVKANTAAAWGGEPLLQRPEVANAVGSVALTAAWRRARDNLPRGYCEVAALLFAALAGFDAGLPEQRIEEVEADTFTCFMALLRALADDGDGSLGSDARLLERASRTHALLSVYDPQVAEVLSDHGLATMPTTRLGVALCTRAGFTLRDCVLVWDSMLADPCRFEFCDYITIATIMLRRREMLRCAGDDGGGLAEALLAAPGQVPAATVLRVAHAICAFERQCGPGSESPFPPRPELSQADFRRDSGMARTTFLLPPGAVLDVPATLAMKAASSVWSRLRKSSAKAWRVGSKAMRSTFSMATNDVTPKASVGCSAAAMCGAGVVLAATALDCDPPLAPTPGNDREGVDMGDTGRSIPEASTADMAPASMAMLDKGDKPRHRTAAAAAGA